MTLEIKDLSKSFGKKVVLSNFSYTFTEKGIFAIKGDSGVGKTTLLRIISGIDKKYTGLVMGGGIGNVSLSFQEYRLFPTLSALENITEAVWEKPGEAEIRKASEMLMTLGFSQSELTLYPDELSGGMKQRVSLARALLRDAPILLLDEPTKELDRDLALTVLDFIKAEAEKRLVIMVTHNESDILILTPTVIDLNTEK